MPFDEHGFSDKETAAIIKRALELQRTSLSGAVGHGLSLEDLERAGSDVGIPPELIRRAAEDLRDGLESRGVRLLGVSTIQDEKVEALWPSQDLAGLSDMIEAAAELPGKGRVAGDKLHWHSASQGHRHEHRSVSVTVRQERGIAKIRAETRLGATAAGLFGGLIGGLGVGGGLGIGFGVGMHVLHSPVATVLLPIGVFTFAVLLSRLIFGQVARAARHRLKRLVQILEKALKSDSEKTWSNPRSPPIS